MNDFLREALNVRDMRLRQIGTCGDGHCIIVKPIGMHTNGGCRCHADRHRMQRFAAINNDFARKIAERINVLTTVTRP